MLIEFRVANYRSFKEEQTLSMVASAEKQHLENMFRDRDLKILKSVGIYGPNASGKSNLIKALSTMKNMVLNSADYGINDSLPVVPFRLDKIKKEEPSQFEILFHHNRIRYQYGFSATNKMILEEWLYATPNNRSQLWFYRTYNKKKDKSEIKFGTHLKGSKSKYIENLNDNNLTLSIASKKSEQMTIIYNWFRDNLKVVSASDHRISSTSKLLLPLDEPNETIVAIQERIKKLVKSADFGIEDVIVYKIDPKEMNLPKDDKVSEELLKFLEKEPLLAVLLAHKTDSKDKMEFFLLDDESDGTKRYFDLIGPWVTAGFLGTTIVFDELERSLHPLLARELIKLIHDQEFNVSKAQLIFATHDTSLLDHEIFRRDQIWFTDKNNTGATVLYPLSDYRPRKGEALQKGYLSGRYDAIPILEEFNLIGEKTKKASQAK